MDRRLRVLVLSRHYPTSADPLVGLWVERMAVAASWAADVQVVVPVPWVPPFMPLRRLSRFRSLPDDERRGNLVVHHPRVLGSVGHLTVRLDARLAFPSVLATARRLHEQSRFDLIHAHFVHPEGVIAARIGRVLGIPVMTSEHALWTPWLAAPGGVGPEAERAFPDLRLVTAVSGFLKGNIDAFARGRVATAVLPNVVDDAIFTRSTRERDPNELLYVGMIRRVKRVDVLLRALAEVRRTRPALHLRVLAANTFENYGADLAEVKALIRSLGLESAVRFEAGAEPPQVAEAMQRCAFVTVSSTRRETFCSVAAEALACGTPLVMTRCGGPEEFVTEDDGVSVPADDPAAFAAGILRAVETSSRFDEEAMRERVVARFGREAWRTRALQLYHDVAAATARTGRAIA
jgi:glycosyltransferase involved in cell wall biosynthesis